MISNTYNESENIIYINREGTISIKEILESIESIDSRYSHMDNLYIIEDMRGSESIFNQNDYDDIIELLKVRLNQYKLVCLVGIVDDPANTALSMLFGSIASSLDNFYYSTFSTMEASKRWISNHQKVNLHNNKA